MELLVYTKDNCPYCAKVKAFLKENNVEYKELNIKEPQIAAELFEKTDQKGVPVIEADEGIVIGFNKPALMKLLGLQQG